MAKLDQVIQKLNADCAQAQEEKTPEAVSRISTIFQELEESLREYIQELTQKPMGDLIRRLEKNQPLTDNDKVLLKMWIVGDADAYVRMENNVNDWVVEMKRILAEISKFSGQEIDTKKAFVIRALLRDGGRVLADIFYFLEELERVKKFQTATVKIDDEDRRMLIRLLQQKMRTNIF